MSTKAVHDILFVSRHDFRTKRKASLHFLARQMGVDHRVRFVSIGFSPLSRLRRDSRCFLEPVANTWQSIDGVSCYLWKTPLHPIDVGTGLVRAVVGRFYDLWSHWPCADFDRAAAASDVIFVESGIAPVFIRRLRRHAPHARIVYIASDLLSTALVHPRIQAILERDAPLLDLVITMARSMLPEFRAFGLPLVFLPHGLDRELLEADVPSPYATPRNVVSVGSMLFDGDAIRAAATAFPDWTFHLIGCGAQGRFPDNVTIHPETPFDRTVAYLRHADLGFAAYADVSDGSYLVDSSMKLMQFGHLGLPALCPDFAAGDKPLRFAYRPGDPASIVAAFRRATAEGVTREPERGKDWTQAAADMLAAVEAVPARGGADRPAA